MRVTYDHSNRLFIWRGEREEAHVPSDAGFEINPWLKKWVTAQVTIAANLVDLMDNDAIIAYESLRHAIVQSEASADSGDDFLCPPGLSYRPYQKVCIRYADKRTSLLIADDMGLGKTIETIGILNQDMLAVNCLVICPASVKINWQRELNKWLMWGSRIQVVWAGDVIRPVSLKRGVTIINYDILKRYPEISKYQTWDYVVIDECQNIKSMKTKRTQAVHKIKARNRLALSGTPILNQPLELWPVLNYLEPSEWNDPAAFAQRYCKAYQTPYGYKYEGGENLVELNERLRSSLMIRRMKMDVLKELPPKIRRITTLPLPTELSGLISIEKERARDLAEIARSIREIKGRSGRTAYKEQVDELVRYRSECGKALATIRRELGEAKAPVVADYVKEAFDCGTRKVLLFAHHTTVIELLENELKKLSCVTLVGDTSMRDRQAAIDRFQADANCKVFIGSIKAAGVGINLTAASHVMFGELDWVPGDISQAEDRAHRMGQYDSVLVEHLVFDGSLDARMAARVVEKQDTIEQAVGRLGIDVDPDWWIDEL